MFLPALSVTAPAIRRKERSSDVTVAGDEIGDTRDVIRMRMGDQHGEQRLLRGCKLVGVGVAERLDQSQDSLVVARGATVEDALRLSDRVARSLSQAQQRGDVSHVVTLSSFLPSLQSQAGLNAANFFLAAITFYSTMRMPKHPYFRIQTIGLGAFGAVIFRVVDTGGDGVRIYIGVLTLLMSAALGLASSRAMDHYVDRRGYECSS
jgi:hypothetical protein